MQVINHAGISKWVKKDTIKPLGQAMVRLKFSVVLAQTTVPGFPLTKKSYSPDPAVNVILLPLRVAAEIPSVFTNMKKCQRIKILNYETVRYWWLLQMVAPLEVT